MKIKSPATALLGTVGFVVMFGANQARACESTAGGPTAKTVATAPIDTQTIYAQNVMAYSAVRCIGPTDVLPQMDIANFNDALSGIEKKKWVTVVVDEAKLNPADGKFPACPILETADINQVGELKPNGSGTIALAGLDGSPIKNPDWNLIAKSGCFTVLNRPAPGS